MNPVLQFFREYPILIGIVLFCSVSVLLAGLLGFLMLRAGLSLRPLIFIFGFIAIVAIPQGVVHLLDALAHAKVGTHPSPASPGPRVSAPAGIAGGPAPAAWDIIFGPDADPSLITDAKRGLEFIVGDSIEAKLSFNSAGESALAARFATGADAMAALNRYGSFFQFSEVTGNESTGWTARRFSGQGEWNHVVAAGRELYAWSGPTQQSVESRRIQALGPLPDAGTNPSSPVAARSADPSRTSVSTRLASNWRVMTLFLVINLALAAFWFFKASAWSARLTPPPDARPVPMAPLRDQLFALNQQNVPVQVTSSPGESTIEIHWRYADLHWFDLMRAHKMQRTHKLVLTLDESSHRVRVREYWSGFDASAGAGNLRFHWTAATGMQFFHWEHQRVLGVPPGADGHPTGGLSQSYTFDLQTLKKPIIDAVLQNGWIWQPVMWKAPAPLRWLTE